MVFGAFVFALGIGFFGAAFLAAETFYPGVFFAVILTFFVSLIFFAIELL